MGIKANRPTAGVQAQQVAQDQTAASEATPQVRANVAPPAVTPQASAPAVASGGGSQMAQLNAGILEGIDDVGGNYVSLDANQFLYKVSNTLVDFVDLIVKGGKRFYQWVDESGENKVYHNADTKLDDRYKYKFEIRWDEAEDEESEPTEYTMSLSTTSALNFTNVYVKKLATAGYAVNQVITRMTTSKQRSRDGKNSFFRVEFEAFNVETGEPLNIKTDPNR
jgi:hypothetical protein